MTTVHRTAQTQNTDAQCRGHATNAVRVCNVSPECDTFRQQLRYAPHQLLLVYIGWKTQRRDDHHVNPTQTPSKHLGCEVVEPTARK